MKIPKNDEPAPMSIKQLRLLEEKLKVYLVEPRANSSVGHIYRTDAQQFTVLDEDEAEAGFVSAERRFFRLEELEQKILGLFERLETESARKKLEPPSLTPRGTCGVAHDRD